MPSQRCYTRSQAAFLFSVDRLFSLNVPVYFWTFTFKEVYDESDYAWRWTAFLKGLEYAHRNRSGRGSLRGLRVVELHKTHGLHYHMLLAGGRGRGKHPLSVHIVRRVGKRFGIGIVDVQKCYDKGVGGYLAKYLAKERRFGSRIRAWGTVGSFLQCRCKDVEIDSPFHRCKEVLVPGQQIDFMNAALIMGTSRHYGDFKHWPLSAVMQCKRSLVSAGYRVEGLKSYELRRRVFKPRQRSSEKTVLS